MRTSIRGLKTRYGMRMVTVMGTVVFTLLLNGSQILMISLTSIQRPLSELAPYHWQFSEIE